MVWCKVDDVLTMLAEIGFCEGIYQEKCEKEMRILEVFFLHVSENISIKLVI